MHRTNQVSSARTVAYSNELMSVVVELTDEGLTIDNIREIIEADIVNLNGLLMIYPSPAFYQCLEQRYQMNERVLRHVESRLEELESEFVENVTFN